jgi:hypothetical protein
MAPQIESRRDPEVAATREEARGARRYLAVYRVPRALPV